jgi:hypothetical protein
MLRYAAASEQQLDDDSAVLIWPRSSRAIMLGWVQLVRPTDAQEDDLEMNPFVLLPEIDVPYCFNAY